VAFDEDLAAPMRDLRSNERGLTEKANIQSPVRLANDLDNLRQANADTLAYIDYPMLAAKGLLRVKSLRVIRGSHATHDPS